MGPGLVLSLVVAAGAVEDVELASRSLVRPLLGDDDVIAAMGPRLLTRESLRAAFEPNPAAFSLLLDADARGGVRRALSITGAVVAVASGVAFGASVGASAALGSLATPLLVGAIAGLSVAVALLVATAVLAYQESRAVTRAIRIWNDAVWDGARGPGAPYLGAARAFWIDGCPDDVSEALCAGGRPLVDDDELLALMDAHSPEAATAFRANASRVVTSTVLYAVGLGVMLGAFVPVILAPASIPAIVVGIAMVVVGATVGLIGGRGLDRAARDGVEIIAQYNQAVLGEAMRAARAESPAAVDPPPESPTAPQVAPDAKPPPAEPTVPPPPPPVGPTRKPLRPQTLLDGPLPALTLLTF